METLLQQGTNYEIYVRDIIKEKYTNSWLWKDIPSEILLELEFIKDIKSVNIEYITICTSEASNYKNKALLCSINNKNTNSIMNIYFFFKLYINKLGVFLSIFFKFPQKLTY